MKRFLYTGTLILILAAIIIGGYIYFYPGNYLKPIPPPNGENSELSTPKTPFKHGTEKENRIIQNSDLARLYPEVVYRFKDTKEKVVALTFDDGPDDIYTPKILKHLKDEKVKATFFISGIRGQEFPDILKDIAKDGHVLGSHGFLHQKYTNLNPENIKEDLKKNYDLIYKHTKKQTKLFRPPYGALDPESVETIEKEGYKIVLWSIDSIDWRSLPKEEIVKNITSGIKPGSVILMHSAGDPKQNLTGSVEAVPIIIKELKKKGYSFVTIPELFKLEEYYN